MRRPEPVREPGPAGRGAMLVKFRYVHRDVDRHGNVRLYFQRKGGPKIRLREEPGSEAFSKAYHALLQPSSTARAVPAGGAAPHQPTAGTYRWLCVEYFKSAAFRRLEKSTQVTRRRVLEQTCLEPVHAGAKETFAAFPLWRLTTRALRVLRDRKADLPGAASDRVKAIRAAFKWACEEDLIDTNPALALAKLPLTGGGFHSWTTEEVARFEARHGLGSKARLALALLLWTGVRRSDLVGLGRQHARAGWLEFTQAKNRNRRPVRIEIPILPQLQEVLEASPTGDLTYLVTEQGRPFSVAGFGNWFRARCNEAGLQHCSAHGLRKAGAATAAENGATTQQLMAIFGWLSLAEAERYTRAAERKRLAAAAMPTLVRKGQ